MYTLDTNAVIYYLNNDPIAVPILQDILHQDVPIYQPPPNTIRLGGWMKAVRTDLYHSDIHILLRLIPRD